MRSRPGLVGNAGTICAGGHIAGNAGAGVPESQYGVPTHPSRAGASLEHWQDAQAHPLSKPGPPQARVARLALATDGVLIPVLPNEWAEVKMTTVADVSQDQDGQVQCEALSYFARLADAAPFADLTSCEIGRRGVAQAQTEAAINDGAEWIDRFVQGHRADALRMLDFAHAAQYIAASGTLAQEAEVRVPPTWLTEQLHALKHEGSTGVLKEVERLRLLAPTEAMSDHVTSLCKREGQMQYPQYQAQGWPTGSGMAESGNKLVVQAHLKGAGMHWHRRRVNPMLALRITLGRERWAQDWPVVRADWQAQRLQRLRTRSQAALAKASGRFQQTFWRLQVTVVLACSPSPPPAPPTPKGRNTAQKRWRWHTFSPRAILEGRSAKKKNRVLCQRRWNAAPGEG